MMSVVDDDVALYLRYADELTRYATALVGPHDAPDVVVDGVLAAFASAGWAGVQHRRAYLYRCVLHRAASVRRSDARRHRRELAAAGSALAQGEDPSIDAHRALARLSPQQRAVVYLTYWDDLAPAQIADLIDVSEGTVRKQLARAREHLRRILDEQ
jgi:RNA polymerase sigma-70 factor (ECF subfamily)